MIQNPRTPVRGIAMLATALVLAAGAASAQDDAPDPTPSPAAAEPTAEESSPAPSSTRTDRLRFYAAAEDWVAQPAGLEYEPVSVLDPNDPFGTTVSHIDFGTKSTGRYGFAVELPQGGGEISGTYWSMKNETETTEAVPGSFRFGTLLSYPVYPGFANDGLADGYLADTTTLLRDVRIDYGRHAFGADRVSGRWFVGYRQVRHDRQLETDYFAFEPLLPPLFPPIVSPPVTGCGPDPANARCLDPLPDTAAVRSLFEGRGLEGGLKIRAPLLQDDRLSIEGGFAVAVLRGEVDTDYRSTNAIYVYTDGLGNTTVLDPPYDEFNDPVAVASITQQTVPFGISTDRRSRNASVIEVELGLRWRFWGNFDVYGGFRTTRYENVGVDYRLGAPSGSNTQVIVEEPRSVYYEGFFFGLALEF